MPEYGLKDSKRAVSSRLRFFTSAVGTRFILAAGVPGHITEDRIEGLHLKFLRRVQVN